MGHITQSSTLANKLKDKVCHYANISATSLPPDAEAWLARRTDDWIVQRTASDADLRRAANDLLRRFPHMAEAGQRHHHHHDKQGDVHHHHHQSAQKIANDVARRGEAKTGASTPSMTGAHASHRQVGSMTSDARGAGASSVPLVERNAAGSPVMSLRPQVLRRMQRLNDDAAFLAAFEKEKSQVEHEQHQRMEEKRQRQEAVKRDMEAAEALRLSQLDAQRDEREKQRQIINAAIDEARLAEMDQKMLRKRNIQRERKGIQEQSRLNEKLRDEAKRKDAEENQRLKDYNWQQDRNKLLQEMEKVTRSKSAMMIALEEGKTSAQAREEHRKAHRMEPSPVFSTRGGSDREDINVTKRRQREMLQEAACRHYDTIQDVKRQTLEKMDHSGMEAHMKQLKQQEEREEKDREKAIRMRAALVSSLDEELSTQRDRRKREEDEKVELRRAADRQMEEVEQQRRNAARKEKREQEQRREQMDKQLASRLERMTQPMSIKI